MVNRPGFVSHHAGKRQGLAEAPIQQGVWSDACTEEVRRRNPRPRGEDDQDRLRDLGESKLTARRQVGVLLDINQATLRNSVERKEIDTGQRPGVTSEESAEVRALRKENAELRRANDILPTASACVGNGCQALV